MMMDQRISDGFAQERKKKRANVPTSLVMQLYPTIYPTEQYESLMCIHLRGRIREEKRCCLRQRSLGAIVERS